MIKDGEVQKVEQSDAAKLRFYLKSIRNREMYWEEIEVSMEELIR